MDNQELYNLRRSDRIADSRPVWLHIGGHSQAAEIKDISDEGACFVLPRPVASNRVVRCQIGSGAGMFQCDGIVVRCEPDPLGRYAVGVRFDASGTGVASRFCGRVSPTIHQ